MRNLTTSRRGITYARQHGLLCEMIDGTDPANKWRLGIMHNRRTYLEAILNRRATKTTDRSFRTPFLA